MAKFHECNVVVVDNLSQFLNPFQFEITFECIEDLPEDLEWKIIYVGSAESKSSTRCLMLFVFQANTTNPEKILMAAREMGWGGTLGRPGFTHLLL